MVVIVAGQDVERVSVVLVALKEIWRVVSVTVAGVLKM